MRLPTNRTQRLSSAIIPLRGRKLRLTVYSGRDGHSEEIVSLSAEPWHANGTPALVRIQSACITGEVFGSEKCDCYAQLQAGIEMLFVDPSGLVLYCLKHEGRGIGLANKLRAYALQEEGFDTISSNTALGLPVDCRDYTTAVDVLELLGLYSVRLITGNPAKITSLRARGITVERVTMRPLVTTHNAAYLQVKRDQMGHLMDLGTNGG